MVKYKSKQTDCFPSPFLSLLEGLASVRSSDHNQLSQLIVCDGNCSSGLEEDICFFPPKILNFALLP